MSENETPPVDENGKPTVEGAAKSPARKPALLRALQFHWEYTFFVLLNLAALFLTLLLGEHVPDKGPGRWMPLPIGTTGYIIYRIVLMLVVIGLAEVVARRRKSLARLLIWFGIALLLAETVMSAQQYYTFIRSQAGIV